MGDKWEKWEDSFLKRAIIEGRNRTYMAREVERSVNAVSKRLQYLNLVQRRGAIKRVLLPFGMLVRDYAQLARLARA